MKYFSKVVFLLCLILTIACGNETETATPTIMPTTEPLTAIEEAILAANSGNYAEADRLLDVSDLASSGQYENSEAYWQWLTSDGRVQTVEVRLEEEVPPVKRIFVVMQNNNFPQQQTGFWVYWQTDKWIATVEQP